MRQRSSDEPTIFDGFFRNMGPVLITSAIAVVAALVAVWSLGLSPNAFMRIWWPVAIGLELLRKRWIHRRQPHS